MKKTKKKLMKNFHFERGYNRKYNLFTELKVFPYATIEDLDKEAFSKVRIMEHNRVGGLHLWERMTNM